MHYLSLPLLPRLYLMGQRRNTRNTPFLTLLTLQRGCSYYKWMNVRNTRRSFLSSSKIVKALSCNKVVLYVCKTTSVCLKNLPKFHRLEGASGPCSRSAGSRALHQGIKWSHIFKMIIIYVSEYPVDFNLVPSTSNMYQIVVCRKEFMGKDTRWESAARDSSGKFSFSDVFIR